MNWKIWVVLGLAMRPLKVFLVGFIGLNLLALMGLGIVSLIMSFVRWEWILMPPPITTMVGLRIWLVITAAIAAWLTPDP